MTKLREQFSDADRQAIEAAVQRAEAGSSGEIVPVVAAVSGPYDRAEDIVGLILAIIGAGVYWYFAPPLASDGWQGAASLPPFWPLALILLIGFSLGAFLAARFPVLRLPFVSRQEMRREVERRARELFQRRQVRATREASGILIYVSLYEHMVHVVGDDAINEKIAADEWRDVVTRFEARVREGGATPAIIAAIERCGELLRAHLPGPDRSGNELADGLILID